MLRGWGSTFATLFVTALASLVACGGSQAESSSESRETGTVVVTVPAGGETSATAIVSGEQRATFNLPTRCESGGPVRGGPENFAYIEVKNPGESAASISLTVDGPGQFNALYAYTSPTAPTTLQAAEQCLQIDEGQLIGASPTQPALSVARDKALVVPARGSVFVLLATRNATGAYEVRVVTDRLAPDPAALTIAPASGGVVSATALTSGAQRASFDLPTGCNNGGLARGGPENFAYIEVKNPGESAASVSLTLEGPGQFNALYAYASPTPPATVQAAEQCLQVDEGQLIGASPTQPALSAANGKALSVPARGSVFVLLATRNATGAYSVRAVTDSVAH
jgi:hypothetical protein